MADLGVSVVPKALGAGPQQGLGAQGAVLCKQHAGADAALGHIRLGRLQAQCGTSTASEGI